MSGKEIEIESKPSFFILGSSSCPACKNAVKKGLAYALKTGKTFRFVDLQKNRNFDDLVKKYNAIPIYVLPDGTVHVGVMQNDELDEALRKLRE